MSIDHNYYDDYYEPIYTSAAFQGQIGFFLILGFGLALLCLI